MGKQDRAGRLAAPDNTHADAARRFISLARIVFGNAAAAVVIDIEGLRPRGLASET